MKKEDLKIFLISLDKKSEYFEGFQDKTRDQDIYSFHLSNNKDKVWSDLYMELTEAA